MVHAATQSFGAAFSRISLLNATQSLGAAFALTSLLGDNAMILLCLAAGVCQAAGIYACIGLATQTTPAWRARRDSMIRATGGGGGSGRSGGLMVKGSRHGTGRTRAGKSDASDCTSFHRGRTASNSSGDSNHSIESATQGSPPALGRQESDEVVSRIGNEIISEMAHENVGSSENDTRCQDPKEGLRLLLSALRRTEEAARLSSMQ
ncbi:hypothetical protein T484DRAFT_1987156, partial [Baffinella frigidus]